jgi:hypothetical protein
MKLLDLVRSSSSSSHTLVRAAAIFFSSVLS